MLLTAATLLNISGSVSVAVCRGRGGGFSLSCSPTTADKQAGEQTGGLSHIHIHTPPANTQRYIHICMSLHRWMYTHTRTTFAYVCETAQSQVAWVRAGDVVGISMKSYLPGFKQLKLMNERVLDRSLQTVQLFQTSQNAFLGMSSDQQPNHCLGSTWYHGMVISILI